jgi:hypothetical protein
MALTDRQRRYAEGRSRGLGQERAAIEAGYAEASAKVSASRMERDPAVRAAIESARTAGGTEERPQQRYEDAEAYLLAVVRGDVPPDPVRVSAARAILPYQRRRERAPLKGDTPKRMAERTQHDAQAQELEAWAETEKRVRARVGRKGT